MPSTVLGVALLVMLALPGYTFKRAADRRSPEHVATSFQELLAVLFVGAIVDVAATVLAVSAALVFDVRRPSLKQLILSPHTYIADHVGLVGSWFLVLLVLANCAAYLWGSGLVVRALPTRWTAQLTDRSRRADPQQSAWWLLFHEHQDAIKHVGCVLDDGSHISGNLYSYSRTALEGQDRDLVLSGDISYRPAGGKDAKPAADISAAIVNARHIVVLTVSYVDLEPDPPAKLPNPASAPAIPTAAPSS